MSKEMSSNNTRTRKRSQEEIIADLHNLVHTIEHEKSLKEHQKRKTK